ncbi:basic blue protein [Lolium perenne]|uniref:basic blue protein n=1 Tax=Lolium perenne TaxID=4522 RepID=UPI0021F58D51|nr:basic blue protein-like [Lolium perenne]
MAAQGRGSAALVAGALLVALLSQLTNTATAKTTYIVGDDAGWTKNLEASWLNGKTFYAGDVLVFKYDKEHHDVSVVGGKGYQRCQLPKHSDHSWVLRTGNDAVTLRRGNNYFICGQPGHCQNNMKLHVNAL